MPRPGRARRARQQREAERGDDPEGHETPAPAAVQVLLSRFTSANTSFGSTTTLVTTLSVKNPYWCLSSFWRHASAGIFTNSVLPSAKVTFIWIGSRMPPLFSTV